MGCWGFCFSLWCLVESGGAEGDGVGGEASPVSPWILWLLVVRRENELGVMVPPPPSVEPVMSRGAPKTKG